MSRTWPTAAFSNAEHGTLAGFQMHAVCGIAVCASCREARNTYMREYMRSTYDPAIRRRRYLAYKNRWAR